MTEAQRHGYSLWTHCLWAEIKKAKKAGKETVAFDDVDARVLKLSKLLTHWTEPKEVDNG